jgi:hypothetical protein
VRKRRLAIILALAAFAGATQGSSGCKTSEEKPTGTSKEAPAGVNAPETSSTREPSAPKPKAEVQVFHGRGEKALGTIVVSEASTVSWSCPGCGKSGENIGENFQVEDSSGSPSFGVNGLGETHGVSALEAGTYHTVVVKTGQEDSWEIRITPGEGSSGAP